ncbi:hypothetical protein GGR50DRAFT_416151 [Xylaria sp. CBS 124048]|nr:hypothetical protein GGR50DRAFT_416151 [Xylaria sp. CBS 124048]
MVSYNDRPQTPIRGAQSGTSGPIDPYVLFEALTGRSLERVPLPTRPAFEGYEDFSELQALRPGYKNGPNPDPKPKDVFVGCINPFALVENLIGHRLDRKSVTATRIIQDTLQTDYDELFDMKHHSVLYAGLKLNKQARTAEALSEKAVKILKERDLVTPNLGNLNKLGDLERIGLKEVGDVRIKRANILNNKLHLVLHADKIAKTVCNNEITQTINDVCLPFRRESRQRDSFTAPNCSWRDAREVSTVRNPRHTTFWELDTFSDKTETQTVRGFDDPVQGATGNSWFVAALFSVYWADPAAINRNTRQQIQVVSKDHNGSNDAYQRFGVKFGVKFYDKGGRNNNRTQTVEVDYRVPVNNSTEDFVYCRSSDGTALWPALYEKAFAKWVNHGSHNNTDGHRVIIGCGGPQIVDITQTYNGDPVKAMAQINGREPLYYFTKKHEATDLVGLVRSHSVNHRTICPMVAWTYAASDDGAYHSCNLVANHAYSVLGWSSVGQGDKQYIIVRNPWGVTEPHGLTSYPGILTRVEPESWGPASLLSREGVMAVEVRAFKEYFACMGVSK